MTDVDNKPEDRRMQKQDWWLDVLITIMLGITALSTAWSGYQASLWNGIQSTFYSQASAKRIESTRASTLAATTRNLDIWMFGQWVEYYATGQTDLADFYQQRFRPEFKPAFEAWIASEPLKNPNAPASPFAMPEYKLALDEQAKALEGEAEKIFFDGRQANATGDRYVLNTVVLASVLFLSGVSSRLNWRRGRIFMIFLALGLLLFGLYNLIVYPITSIG